MAGASDRNSFVAGYFYRTLFNHLPQRRQPFMETMTLRFKLEKSEQFYNPDNFVACENDDRASHVRREPILLVEVLSPTNKRGKGLEEFQTKRQELLDGPAHYLEIDLLRIGDRFPSPNALPSVPYFVFLSRANRRPRIEAWPIALDQPLPTVPVPLLVGDPDEMLDLQRALNTIYEHYYYERATRHSGEPVVPLSEEQQAWADECLRKAGLRT